jgi:hypothetical protein
LPIAFGYSLRLENDSDFSGFAHGSEYDLPGSGSKPQFGSGLFKLTRQPRVRAQGTSGWAVQSMGVVQCVLKSQSRNALKASGSNRK